MTELPSRNETFEQKSKEGIKVLIGNHPDLLIEKLKEELYSERDNFTSKLLVVPCDHVKKKIEHNVCSDPNYGVFLGINTLNLNLAISELLSIFGLNSSFANQDDLSFLIEKLIGEYSNEPCLVPLMQYFKSLADPREGKAIFCDHLAGLFLNYGLYLGNRYSSWKAQKGYQQFLYRKVLQYYQLPIETAMNIKPQLTCRENYEVHLFGCMHIPWPYLALLYEMASSNVKIYFYLLSFSSFYWGDLLSNYQQRKLVQAVKNEKQIEAVQDFIDKQNPIFANFCQFGQDLFTKLIDLDVQFHEHYVDVDGSGFSLLDKLKRELYYLSAPPLHQEKITECDQSIQFFLSINRLREIENIHSQILEKILHDNISCDQVAVLAPDIQLYAPFIEFVFGVEESPVGYIIEGLDNASQSEVLRVCSHLVSMVESRWEKKEILGLLNFKIIRHKFALNEADLNIFYEWFERTQLTWGYHKEHRNQFIQTQQSTKGTLVWVFEELLLSLAVCPDSETMSNRFTPVFSTNLSLAPLIEKLIVFFEELFSALMELKEAKLTLKQWYQQLLNLFTRFVEPPSHLLELKQEYSDVIVKLKNSFKSHTIMGDFTFTFDSISPAIKRMMKSKNGRKQSNKSPRIRFASIQPGEALCCDLVVFIGMNQSMFPRITSFSSLNELARYKDSDYFPLIQHQDRYCILEAISTARKGILISAQEKDQEGNPDSFCIPIIQLQAYLDELFSIGSDQRISEKLTSFTPSVAFDEKALQKCYIKYPFQFAAHYSEKLMPKELYLKESSLTKTEPITIDIHTLMKITKNPIQYICNEFLEFFRFNYDEEAWLKEFTLSQLDKGKLRGELLRLPLEKVVGKVHRYAPLASDLFSKSLHMRLNDELIDVECFFLDNHISQGDLFSVSLHPFTKKPIQISKTQFEHPPITVKLDDGRHVNIIGRISHLFEEGMMYMGKGKVADYLKAWPAFLVLQELDIEKFKRKKLFLMRDRTEKEELETSKQALKQLIEYALSLSQRFSLLLPSLSETILFKDKKTFEKEIKQIFAEGSYRYSDSYLDWLCESEEDILKFFDYDQIADEMRRQFSEFINWAQKRKVKA